MKVIFYKTFLYLVSILAIYGCNYDKRLKVKRTDLQPKIIFERIAGTIKGDSSFQFYFDGSNHKGNVIRVIINDSIRLTVRGWLSNNASIKPDDSQSRTEFKRLIKKNFDNISMAYDSLINLLNHFCSQGIYAIAKGNGFLKIQTFIQDSTYHELRNARSFYDRQYERIIKDYPQYEYEYCIGFYVMYLREHDFIVDILQKPGRTLYKIYPNVYYYRDPIRL